MNAQKYHKFQPGILFTFILLAILGIYQPASAQQTSTPNGAPTILEHPQDATAVLGSSVTFSVRAEGTAPLSYQWQRDGVDIPGATMTSLAWANLKLSDDGAQVRVIVSNAEGSVTSNAAT